MTHFAAVIDERSEMRIDVYIANKAIKFVRRCTNQVDLANHAFARPHCPGLPFFFDLVPLRIGKTLEKKICCVERSDGPVKIYEDVELHTHTCQVWRTR